MGDFGWHNPRIHGRAGGKHYVSRCFRRKNIRSSHSADQGPSFRAALAPASAINSPAARRCFRMDDRQWPVAPTGLRKWVAFNDYGR